MITLRTATALAGLGLALALSGCSSSDTADTSSSETAVTSAAWCEGAAKVQSEVDKMATLIDEGSSTDLVKAQWNAVQSAIEANSVPLSQLPDATQEEVAAAYDTFTTAVEAIPDDLPPSEAAPQYEAAIERLTSDMDSIEAEVCS
jgi:hypothetical protein